MTTKKSGVAIWKNRGRSFQRDVGALLANWRCVLVWQCAADKRRRSVRRFRLGWRWFGLFGSAAVVWAQGRGWEERRCPWRRWWWRRDPLCRRWQLWRQCVDVWSWRYSAGRWKRRRSLSRLLKTTWTSGDDVDEVEVQQEQAIVADVAEVGRHVLDENEVAVDEDGYAERGVGAAVSGRTSNDMQKARGWDDFGDDCAGTSPDFYPAAPPGPSLSDKFQPQLDVWNWCCSTPKCPCLDASSWLSCLCWQV